MHAAVDIGGKLGYNRWHPARASRVAGYRSKNHHVRNRWLYRKQTGPARVDRRSASA